MPSLPVPQPRWLTVVLALAAVTFTAAGLASTAVRPGELPVSWEGWLLSPAMGAALMVAGRRWPIAALLISAALLYSYYSTDRPSIGFAILIAPAIVNAAERGHLKAAAALSVVAVLSTYGIRLLFLGQGPQILGTQLLTEAAVVAGALAVGDTLYSRSRWTAEARRRHTLEREADIRERETRLESERRIISREIHDGVGHALIIISQQASVALATLGNEGDARQALRTIKNVTTSAHRDVDQVVGVLRSDPEHTRPPSPRLDDIEAMLDAVRQGGRTVNLSREGDLASVGAVIEGTVTRVVQEALANVQRHSTATKVDIDLAHRSDELVVTVLDNGGAGDWQPSSGLSGMQERIALVHGTLRIDASDRHFSITATIPL